MKQKQIKIDVHAPELAKWKNRAGALAQQLQQLEETAAANDDILLTLHQTAVLLIERKDGWREQVEKLLKKRLSLAYCRIIVYSVADKAPAAAARLPVAGRLSHSPNAALADKKAGAYLHLPLKKSGKTAGLLTLAAKRAEDFPANSSHDFVQRLAQMLTATL